MLTWEATSHLNKTIGSISNNSSAVKDKRSIGKALPPVPPNPNKLKELNLTKVYIATNSDVPEDLNYIHKNLPTFKYPKENMSNIDYAILETLICTKATYFIGTDTSLYSTYIIGERINLNKDAHEIFKHKLIKKQLWV